MIIFSLTKDDNGIVVLHKMYIYLEMNTEVFIDEMTQFLDLG